MGGNLFGYGGYGGNSGGYGTGSWGSGGPPTQDERGAGQGWMLLLGKFRIDRLDAVTGYGICYHGLLGWQDGNYTFNYNREIWWKLIMNMCDPGMLWAASFVFVLVLSVPCFGSWSLVPWQKEATLKLERAPFTASFQHFVTQKKAKEFWKGKAFWAPFRFLFFGGYVQSPLLASVQGFGDRLRYALLQAKRSAGKPSARGTSGTAPEMQ